MPINQFSLINLFHTNLNYPEYSFGYSFYIISYMDFLYLLGHVLRPKKGYHFYTSHCIHWKDVSDYIENELGYRGEVMKRKYVEMKP